MSASTLTVAEAVGAPSRAGISWAAVFAGAVVATAVTIMLVALGSGLGLAFAPSDAGSSAVTFTVMTAIWLIIVQWVASFFGGYLAGRLRGGLAGVHSHEVTFRDTASGFVAWAVTSVFIVGMIASGASSLAGGIGRTVATVAASAGQSYLVDTLFRPSQPAAQGNDAASKAEAAQILATAATGPISAADHDYLNQMVAAQTGLAPADAAKRVDAVIAKEDQIVAKAKQAANVARKAASSFALYSFFSMLIGAFIACVAGAIGGRQRDTY
jgi:hypothetical protein